MFIIFGWGFQTTKKYGPTFKNNCGHCGNEEYWVLTRTITWITLFFIPIIPYSIKYFLMCPLCTYGVYLHGKELDDIKILAEANSALIEGQISNDEYSRRLGLLVPMENEALPYDKGIELKPISNQNRFCSKCGFELKSNANFCTHCGNKIQLLIN